MDTMEIDIDLGDDLPEIQNLDVPTADPARIINDSPAPQIIEDAVPNKVHVRGVDDLSTADLEAFSAEHYPHEKPKVEWIDDTSANLIYEESEAAQKALLAFTSLSAGNSEAVHQLQLRAAKPLSSRSDTHLQVRTAVTTDRKKARAREASRYYLLHPEEDPQEKRRSQRPQRRRRQSDDEVEKFDASMYDDDEGALAVRRNRRGSSGSDLRSRRGPRADQGRDRSASPRRAGSRGEYRRRSRDNGRGRDLFEDSKDHGSLLRGSATKELFPASVKAAKNKVAASNLKTELFPMKTGSAADSTADLFSKTMTVPLVDGAQDSGTGDFPLRSDAMYEQQKRKEQSGFSIRGAAGAPDGDQGFSIRGSAGQKKSIKELFPEKSGPNAGKELFGVRPRRNKAADLFG